MNDLEKQSIEQFDTWAQVYDQNCFWPFYLSNKAVLKVLPLEGGSSILDVGCGTGILLGQLVRSGFDLILHGIDNSPQMVTVAQSKLGASVKLHQGSASHLPYRNGSFDFVTCATSFHHHPDPLNSLAEMFRVLKPAGKLVLLDPFIDGVPRKMICLLLNFISGETGINLFTRDQMKNMFREAGFGQVFQKPYLYYKLITVGIK